jgi:tRNA(fMet)-specific endonuclease VapC
MEATNLVVDTSVFIEYLRAKNKQKTTLFSITNSNLLISAVTVYELYMGATNEEKKDDVQLLIKNNIVLPFSAEVAAKASAIYHELKKKNQIIEFRDIFIGAISIVYDMPLKTLNKKHFQRIKGVKIAE